MTRLWADNFDEQDWSARYTRDTWAAPVLYTPGSNGISGYSLGNNVNGFTYGSSWRIDYEYPGTEDTLIVGFDIRNDGITPTSICAVIPDGADPLAPGLHLVLDTDRSIEVHVGSYTSSTSLGKSATGLWGAYTQEHVEWKFRIHATEGFFVVRVNGVEVLNVTGVDTTNGLAANIDRLAFHGTGLTTSTDGENQKSEIDNLYILDTTGGSDDDFLGQGDLTNFPPPSINHVTAVEGVAAEGLDLAAPTQRVAAVEGVAAEKIVLPAPTQRVSVVEGMVAVGLPPPPGSRLAAQAVEVVRQGEPDSRLGSQSVEVVLAPQIVYSWLGGQAVEVVRVGEPDSRLGSQSVEVVVGPPPPVPPLIFDRSRSFIATGNSAVITTLAAYAAEQLLVSAEDTDTTVPYVAEQLLVSAGDTDTSVAYAAVQLLGKAFDQRTSSVSFARQRTIYGDLSQEVDVAFQRERSFAPDPINVNVMSVGFDRLRTLGTRNTGNASVGFDRTRTIDASDLRRLLLQFNRSRGFAFDGGLYQSGQVDFLRSRGSTYIWKPPKKGDLPTDPLITVTESMTYTMDLTGFTMSGEETDFGATGASAAWIKISPPEQSSVLVQNVATTKAELLLFALDDPTLPAAFANLTPVGEFSDLADGFYSTYDLYLMVDITSASGTTDLIFTIDPTGESLSVSTDVSSVSVTPASISVAVSGSAGISVFDIQFDSFEIASGLTLDADGNWIGGVVLPQVDVGVYDLIARTTDSSVVSDPVSITVETSTIPPDGGGTTDPPSVPSAAVSKWHIYDPVTESRYIFPMNPDSAASQFYPRRHSAESTTKPSGFVVFQGSSAARRYQFSGTLLDDQMYQDLLYWSRFNRRLYLIDHNRVAFQIAFEQFDVRPRTNAYNPYVQDYTMTVLLIAGPFDAPLEE